MLSLKLSEIAMWTRGVLHGTDVHVQGVFTDTRAPQAGALFIALVGENFDAHEFVAAAAQAGAVAAVVAHPAEQLTERIGEDIRSAL